jgi:hypothetical protein
MNVVPVAAVVIVLSVAACAGVGFACGPGPTHSSLVWINPSGSRTPAPHTFITCSESGGNTANLALAAGNLGPGDGCVFGAKLANVGDKTLTITERVQKSTPHGAPPFSSCFSFSVSPGPSSGTIRAGSSYAYTFTIQMLTSATGICQGVTGKVVLTFTGTVCGGDRD